MKTLIHIGLGLVFLCSVTLANAQFILGGYTDKSAICADEKQAGVIAGDAVGYLRGFGEGDAAGYLRGFGEGDAAGDAAGYLRGFGEGDAAGYLRGFGEGDTTGYTRGIGEGTAKGIAQCFADPQSCNITLASCVPAAVYGETEPNDNMIAADPLQLNEYIWGQNYQADDQDWFYTETTIANQNMLLTFKVPGGEMKGWLITIRDATGNVFATFDTSIPGEVPTIAGDEATTYRVTLGLVGTYYIMVQPIPTYSTLGNVMAILPNYKPYAISAILQDSTLNTGTQPIVGFSDTEIEPNDVPSQANWLAPSVSMYGLVNLMFNGVVTDGTDSVWGQGEDDWYVFNSHGNELLTLTFCAKQVCGPGSWFVEVYDEATAQQLEAGELRQNVKPLLAFNTDTGDVGSDTYRLGLKNEGKYYMRVDHKRLFDAPCGRHQFVSTTSPTGFVGSCDCEDKNSCTVPTSDCANSDLGLICTTAVTDCNTAFDAGCLSADGLDGRPKSPIDCGVTESVSESGATTTTVVECDTYQTVAQCSCSYYSGVIEIPAEAITSQYNFTWFSTQLPPNTYDTEAYQEFLNRSNPYQ